MAILAGDCPTCRLFDATGVELEFVQWCDTETGEAVHFAGDSDGNFVPVVGDDGELHVRAEWRQHPAPLRVEWRT